MSGRRSIALIALLLSIGILSVPSAQARAVANGRIYYEAANPRPARLLSILPDGTDRTLQFADGSFWETARIALSPDGTRMALGQYHSGRSTSAARLVTVDVADGANLTVVRPASDSFYASVSWDPTGTQLLFTRLTSHGGYRLYSCNTDGSGLAKIGTFQVFDAAMSPDGTQIAFTNREERLSVMDANGANPQVLIGTGRSFDPSWSPDGSTIAFSRVRPNARFEDLYTIAPDGTSFTRVLRTPKRAEGAPAWAPDGTRIAYVAYSGDFTRSDLFSVAPDGTARLRLTDTPGAKFLPQWAAA